MRDFETRTLKVYKIRHLPTGLYFCPSREILDSNGNYCKSNLSKKGKIYHTKPSLKWINGAIYTHLHFTDKMIPAPDDHWEIQEL